MAERLRTAWVALSPMPGQLLLGQLWAEAERQFVSLITLLPHLLESYQSEDAAGSTVRRWTVLNDQASITIDASVHRSASAPKAGPNSADGPAPDHSRSRLTVAQQQQGEQRRGHADAVAASTAARVQPESFVLPRAVAQELDFLKKRHGLVQHCPASDAGIQQLEGLHITPAGAGPVASSASTGMQAAANGVVLAAFDLELRPTDPAWPSVYPKCLLHGWLSAGYPKPGCLSLQVSPQQEPPLPLLQRQVLDKLLAAEVAAAAGRPNCLRNVVRYVENHAGQMWQQAEDIAAEVARRRRQQPEESAPQEQQQRSRVGTGTSDSSIESETESGCASESESHDYSSDTSGDGEAMNAKGAAGGSGSGGAGHSDAVLPLLLQLDSLQLDGCDALELLRLNLQLTCSRCKASGEMSFATAAVALPSDGGAGAGGRSGSKARGSGTLTGAAECSTCHADWEVEVAPKLLHERSNVLAHVRCQGCIPSDLLPSMLAGQCGSCASSASFRSVATGRWNERACSSCHNPMRFQFSTALFVPHRQQGQGGASKLQPSAEHSQRGPDSAAQAAANYNGLLQRGQPLPDKGTCKHYRHSYRWLRFPCCGKRFPCDLCHETETDGHDMKWATSMVCGYCSLEQAVKPECKGCSKKLATSASAPTGRNTRYWEGGKGQRDPSKLHKDDPRRYRSKAKTLSAKSKRVGQEGKARRERRAQQQE